MKTSPRRYPRRCAICRLGETEIEKMQFPALQLEEAVGIFTQAAYGKRLKIS